MAGRFAQAADAPTSVQPPASTSYDGAAIDALFDRSIVIDALSADEDWGDLVFEAVKRSGLTAIQTSLANQDLTVAQRDLKEWQGRFDTYPDRLMKVVRGREIAEAKKTGRLGVVLGFQNATMIGSSVKNLDVLHAAGTRCIQLTYNARNLLGDGCTERTNAGLSDFGVDIVQRMNELRIVVDLSHCGEQTSKDGIAFSRLPAAFTHTMCKAIHDHVRAKSDELLKAMAAKGGMIGVATLGYFIGPTPGTSFDDYLRHVDHAVKVAGIDHVGVASDYAIRGIEATATRESWYVPRLKSFKPIYNVRWPPWIKELDPPDRFRTIAHGLARRGYKTGDIEKIIGGNWARYLTEVLGN
ncbi:MAG: membrane dipeptidase [Acidobacteria bacterium]|nr:membrane dipeptidase [Acidobacteriota bacterium]